MLKRNKHVLFFLSIPIKIAHAFGVVIEAYNHSPGKLVSISSTINVCCFGQLSFNSLPTRARARVRACRTKPDTKKRQHWGGANKTTYPPSLGKTASLSNFSKANPSLRPRRMHWSTSYHLLTVATSQPPFLPTHEILGGIS